MNIPLLSNRDAIGALLSLLEEQQTFLVTSHARPDGDAIGSSLGLMHLLEALGKDVTVAFADPIPLVYRSFPGIDRIVNELPAVPPDAAVLLECDSVERTGFNHIECGVLINIDHHLSGQPFADFNWIDPEASAVGAMIYDLVLASGLKMLPEIATSLYLAVLTDTGSFTYATTTASTFALAQHLVESGADPYRIAEAVYFSNSPGKVRLLGSALGNLHIEGPVAWSSISEAEIEEAGAVVEDCEGVVNYLIGIAGVEAAAFFRELPLGRQFRLSMRSKGAIDVAAVAERFGGGGHRNASGCTVSGNLNIASQRVLQELRAACVQTA
jgi:bifunctional oligoribonuclease and PAP phosphatase NrnA